MKTKLCYLLSFLLIFTIFLFIVIKSKITYAPIFLFPFKQLVKLSYVIDGDTIIVDGNKKVRYIGINTPELKTQISPDECFAREALDENKKLLANKQIFLEKDVSETDKYRRLLRYVYVGDLFVNDYLIRNGFAKIDTYPPDTKYYYQFKQAEQEARDNNRGLWKECPTN